MSKKGKLANKKRIADIEMKSFRSNKINKTTNNEDKEPSFNFKTDLCYYTQKRGIDLLQNNIPLIPVLNDIIMEYSSIFRENHALTQLPFKLNCKKMEEIYNHINKPVEETAHTTIINTYRVCGKSYSLELFILQKELECKLNDNTPCNILYITTPRMFESLLNHRKSLLDEQWMIIDIISFDNDVYYKTKNKFMVTINSPYLDIKYDYVLLDEYNLHSTIYSIKHMVYFMHNSKKNILIGTAGDIHPMPILQKIFKDEQIEVINLSRDMYSTEDKVSIKYTDINNH